MGVGHLHRHVDRAGIGVQREAVRVRGQVDGLDLLARARINDRNVARECGLSS